ncbi:uncharacterized protein LOC133904220 [Phragmites australis]|uniref:uncharacterized protein LOC133904220 n=1 Tax=Phragmites australis TaxID=29695 RepID=UPI002D78C2B6|nr:uncharacterized protein LOC133904220 [Phragmites australis]
MPAAHTTLVPSTATATANVTSIKSHIPIVLSMKATNYTMWSVFFKAMCGKFHLLHHIDGSILAAPTNPTWIQEDCNVLSWLFGCIHENVLTVMGDLSVTEYSQCVKSLADDLCDVGHAMYEPALVLNLLCGLRSSFANAVDNIAFKTPLPSFSEACSYLLMMEMHQKNDAASSTVLAIFGRPHVVCGSGGCQ